MRLNDLIRENPNYLSSFIEELETYWSRTFGYPVSVTKGKSSKTSQVWYGHSFLNYVAGSHPSRAVFSNIVREYGFSKNIFLRPFQKMLVQLLVHPWFRKITSDIVLTVDPPIQPNQYMIILGGRNKVRINNLFTQESISIYFRFSDPSILLSDYFAKSIMPEKHIISNKLVSLSDRVIVEPYLALTPLNRYPKSFFVTHCDQPYKFLDDHLHRPSIFSLDTCQYLNELLSYVHSYSSELYSLLSRYLDSKSASLSQSIDLSYSHGDFHDSNIL